MRALFVWLGVSVGGGIGWWALSKLGIFPAFLGSLVGTALGIFLARKLARHFGG